MKAKARLHIAYCDIAIWARRTFNPRERKLLAFTPIDSDFELWKKILYAIDLDKVPAYALSLRQKRGEYGGVSTSEGSELKLLARVQKPALGGSFHIAFVIKFSDGVKWLLKVPATGYGKQFTKLEAQSLDSEVLTMQFLKRETTIPIPEVYGYSNSSDNAIKCPFIMMEYIAGISLQKCWFNRRTSQEALESHRETALNDIASAMLQMNRFTFSQSGTPFFAPNGALISVGPGKDYDNHAMLAKRRVCLQSWSVGDMSAAFCEMGPFSDFKSFMLRHLDHRSDSAAAKDPNPYTLGIDMLLRLFVDWLPIDHESDREAPFVLTHPDFAFQNILVSEEGKLLAFIDWDGVSLVPRCMGNERYPNWLTRDWDPTAYAYSTPREAKIAQQKEEDEGPMPENSPEELKRYRAMYASIITKLKSPPATNCNLSSASSQDSVHDNASTKDTRYSLILENIGIAIDDETTSFYIVNKIYNEIIKLQTHGQITESGDLRCTDNDDDDDDDDEEEEEEEQNKANAGDGTGDINGGRKTEEDTQGDNTTEGGIQERVEEAPSENTDSEFYWPKSLWFVCNGLIKGEENAAVLRGVRDGFLMLFKEMY